MSSTTSCSNCGRAIYQSGNTWVHLHTMGISCDVVLQATPPTTPSAAAMRAAEELKPCIDPFFMLNRDWKTEVAAIITRHLAASPVIAQEFSTAEEFLDAYNKEAETKEREK